jgi:protein arginine kinase
VDPRLQPLLGTVPAWLEEGGPEGDVVVASRVRLARNLAGTPFPAQMQIGPASDLVRRVAEALPEILPGAAQLDPAALAAADGEFLVERSLASHDLLHAGRATLIGFEPRGRYGLMVNEEDHFRIQAYAPGLDLDAAARRAQWLERRLRTRFPFATHARYGFLTSCPTNTGTGLRASLLMHLPALSRAKAPMHRALQTARGTYLAVRGVHGEGSRALGRLFQISNQRTLGTSSAAQIQAVTEFGKEVAKYERKTREQFQSDASARSELLADVAKAHARLCEAPTLTTAEALEALSTRRLASLAGLAEATGHSYDARALLQQMFQLQPGHLQARLGREMPPGDRDRTRAELLRSALDLAV